mmetsp:Transcript_14468/g.20842  ORF Transcript_14468/g.20842 Transcript_14468/m.20842 type:complete len:122 (+) Transcript_14468:5522-5887(+)
MFHLRLDAPYVKYVHLAHDRWREDRDENGWRTRCPVGSGNDVLLKPSGDITEGAASSRDVGEPDVVLPYPGLTRAMEVLLEFMDCPTPIMQLLRPVRSAYWVSYGFVDASKEGHGGGGSPM